MSEENSTETQVESNIGAIGEVGSAPETGDTTTSSDAAAAAVTSAENVYQPNFKFKVMDEEKEIDEWLRPVIKDADTEKKIRELYEKAYGLDYVKPKYENTKKEYDALNQQWTTVSTDLQKLGTFLKNKDYGSFFNSFKLSDEEIFKYALDRLDYHEMPPEKRQALDAQMQRNQEYADLMMQNQQFKQQQEQQQVGQMLSELDANINAPHVASIAQAFDARAGKPGAFRDAVIAYGQSQFHIQGKDIPVNQAVSQFIQTFGLVQADATAPATQAAPESATAAQQRPATLPKVGGSGTTTPVKTKVKNLADLRKLQEQAFSSGHG